VDILVEHFSWANEDISHEHYDEAARAVLDAIMALIDQAVADERERLAKLAEQGPLVDCAHVRPDEAPIPIASLPDWLRNQTGEE
jgi:hypothetical protein